MSLEFSLYNSHPEHSGPPRHSPYDAENYEKGMELARRSIATEQPEVVHLTMAVMKLATDCNLRCGEKNDVGVGYRCYEYLDESWRKPPRFMPFEVAVRTVDRMIEHSSTNKLPYMSAAFHGGEPLKIGAARLNRIATMMRQRFAEECPDTTLQIAMQTNGTLLNKANLDVLEEHNIGVAVSLDGGREEHDRNRTTKGGQPSYDHVVKGLGRLLRPEYKHLLGGFLAVVDLRNDPLKVYEGLKVFNPPEIDLLLPYGTWKKPPPGIAGRSPFTAQYGDWMLKVYDAWQEDNIRYGAQKKYGEFLPSDWESIAKPPDIRFFRSIIRMAMGGQSSTEAIGPYAGREFVVRTDGTLELPDSLRVISPDAVDTGFNVHTDSLETVEDFMRTKHLLGKKKLPLACQNCRFSTKVRDICGGGHPATQEADMDIQGIASSVFCNDNARVITRVTKDVENDLAQLVANIHAREALRSFRFGE